MATLLVSEVKHEDWSELQPATVDAVSTGRAGWLWTLVGLALLGAFLAFMVDDHPLRALIAAN